MLNQKPTNYLIISLALGCIFIFNTRVLTNTAVAWAQKKSLTKTQAKQEIIKIAAYEQKKFGGYADTSAADTLLRIIKGYFNYQRATLKKNITVDDIIAEIKKDYLIIAPFNGQK